MPERCTAIIDKLIEERHNRGMTQRELAEAANLPQAAIGRFESKKVTPQLDTLIRVAEALNCDIAIISKS